MTQSANVYVNLHVFTTGTLNDIKVQSFIYLKNADDVGSSALVCKLL